jgi:hypothetical protein
VADLQAHVKEVQRVLRQVAGQLNDLASRHDKSVFENMRQYVAGLNEQHAAGAATYKPWQTKEHARAEGHHWDLAVPARPTLPMLIEYLVERAVESWQFESLPPEPAQIDQKTLEAAFRNTEEDIRKMEG